jgi:hypothetical protein
LGHTLILVTQAIGRKSFLSERDGLNEIPNFSSR